MEYLLGEPVGGRMHLDKIRLTRSTIPPLLGVFPEARLIIALGTRGRRLKLLFAVLAAQCPERAISDVARTAQRYALDMSAWLSFAS